VRRINPQLVDRLLCLAFLAMFIVDLASTPDWRGPAAVNIVLLAGFIPLPLLRRSHPLVAMGLWAGLINTVVGSGTLVTFPVLVALGYPPVTATTSNAIGLITGSATGAVGSIGVNFEGKLLKNDEGKNVDPDPATTGANSTTEFWVVLYQRAYLKYFQDRDITSVDSIMSFTSDNDTAQTMKNVLGRDTSTEGMPWFAEDLRGKLQNGQVVNAGGTGHRYAVLECFKDSNDVWKVKLFNPRAYDGTHNDMPIIESGDSDGVFYMTWSNFTNSEYFTNYTFSRT